jgi:hypothetical protein
LDEQLFRSAEECWAESQQVNLAQMEELKQSEEAELVCAVLCSMPLMMLVSQKGTDVAHFLVEQS